MTSSGSEVLLSLTWSHPNIPQRNRDTQRWPSRLIPTFWTSSCLVYHFLPAPPRTSCLSLAFLTPPFYPGTRLRAFPPSILPLLSVFGVRQISLFKIWFSKLILPAEAEFCNQFTGFICGVFFFFFLLSFINTHTSQLLCTQQKKKKNPLYTSSHRAALQSIWNKHLSGAPHIIYSFSHNFSYL